MFTYSNKDNDIYNDKMMLDMNKSLTINSQ